MHRVGELVRVYREQLGISQVELGRRAGVSSVTILRIERGERGASLELLSDLAQILGIGPRTLGSAILVYESPPESDR
jgi:transcriptional regulator with XRE-family HTH domain